MHKMVAGLLSIGALGRKEAWLDVPRVLSALSVHASRTGESDGRGAAAKGGAPRCEDVDFCFHVKVS